VVEVHDAFNSLLPIGLTDLGLVDAEDAIEALVGALDAEPQDPLGNPVTGPRGRAPANLSGGLKARGHPVGGTGLFQICENYLQLCDRFPVREAQVPDARIGIAHSIGGPGNNNYVTILERVDSRRKRDDVSAPRLRFESRKPRPAREPVASLHGASAEVAAATTIHVTSGGGAPIHVALLEAGSRRLFAKLDRDPDALAQEPVEVGQHVRIVVKDDGEPWFQPAARPSLGRRLVGAFKRRAE
jgi:hypothetical protein